MQESGQREEREDHQHQHAPEGGAQARGGGEHGSQPPMLRLAMSVVADEAARRQETGDDRAMPRGGMGGQAIELPHRVEMEHHFGCSFSHVRASVDPAATLAMNARAYTFGSSIVFSTPTPDQELVRHELTHVVQQTTGRAGSVASDEAEAVAVGAGAKPQQAVGEEKTGQAEVRKDTLLTADKIKSAVTFNNSHWQDPHRKEILATLRAATDGDAFTDPDVLKIASMQEKEGVEPAGIDGKLGAASMAVLLRNGLKLTMGHVKAEQVRLVFYPGEFEDLKQWQANRDAAGMKGKDGEFRHVPAPHGGHGTVYVELNGNVVDRMDARGGPPFAMKDLGGHTADPSQAGTYKLGQGKSVVTPSWANSQIAWGAPIREKDGAIQFKNPGEDWKWATGAKKQIGEIQEEYFHENQDLAQPVIKEWRNNDFGETGFKIEGSPGLYIHTSPDTEEALKVGKELELDHSHGCVHVQPAKRNELMKEGYLQKGVTLVIKKYTESLDPKASNRK